MDWSDLKDLLDQAKADFSSKEEKEQAIKERDKLMSDMEFQNRAQHQIQKQYPEYSKTYGARSIYEPQNLQGFMKNPEIASYVNNIINIRQNADKSPNDASNEFIKYYDDLLKLRDVSENIAANTLNKDKLKATNEEDFISKLQNNDNLRYAISHKEGYPRYNPDENTMYLNSSQENLDPIKAKADALHEHLHAKMMTENPNIRKDYHKKEDENGKLYLEEQPEYFFKDQSTNKKINDDTVDSLKEAKDTLNLKKFRDLLSSTHFGKNALPELYVQDLFEKEFKDKGFETRKDPIKSRFERLKQLMRY